MRREVVESECGDDCAQPGGGLRSEASRLIDEDVSAPTGVRTCVRHEAGDEAPCPSFRTGNICQCLTRVAVGMRMIAVAFLLGLVAICFHFLVMSFSLVLSISTILASAASGCYDYHTTE
ncbi:unnamed protein product, partial [Amoebophrya sp. A25]|eukprot:GSA25T00013377001.1